MNSKLTFFPLKKLLLYNSLLCTLIRYVVKEKHCLLITLQKFLCDIRFIFHSCALMKFPRKSKNNVFSNRQLIGMSEFNTLKTTFFLKYSCETPILSAEFQISDDIMQLIYNHFQLLKDISFKIRCSVSSKIKMFVYECVTIGK